jgi:hypothetical protein
MLRKFFPTPPLKRRHLAAYFVAGAVGASIFFILWSRIRRSAPARGGVQY